MGLFDSMKKMYRSYSNLKIKQKIDIDTLFDIMKDGNYSLGKPEITGKGMMRTIHFRSMGKDQVLVSIMGKMVSVQKGYDSTQGVAKDTVDDELTGGWYSGVNKENLDINQVIEAIGKEIARLLEEKDLLA